jgi:hypothetical protein
MFGQRLSGRFAHPKRDLISWNGPRLFQKNNYPYWGRYNPGMGISFFGKA